MKLFLSKKCHLVKGFKNAAIYDLVNKKVYSVNEDGKDLIEEVISDNDTEFQENEIEFFNELIKLNLLSNTPSEDNSKDIIKQDIQLEFVWLELTKACNLRCIHCYGEFGKPVIDKDKMLSTNEWKNVIDNLVLLGCKDIQLIGGEPMAHNGFLEILNYAHEKGMKRIDVFTNATMINEQNVKELKKCNANVRVSVYGHYAEIHDKITKSNGSFEKNKNGLLLLKKYNIDTTIAVVLMKENEKYINEIRKYIESLGHKYSGYDVIRPSCMDNKYKHSVSDIDILKKRYIIKPEFYTNENSFIQNHFYNACWNSKIAITSYGDVIPCIFARDDIVGNIKKDNIEVLKKNIISKWSITKDSIDICKDCEYRYCCHDCRPLAKGIEGNDNAKYPRCSYNPYKGEWEEIESYTKELNKE